MGKDDQQINRTLPQREIGQAITLQFLDVKI